MIKNGFTLIELLVAMTIIAILSTIALLTFREVLAGARDGKRQTDLKQIQSALEQYRADVGFYPTIAGMNAVLNSEGALTNSVGNPSTPPTQKTYLNKLPKDPINNSTHKYCYDAYTPPTLLCDNIGNKCFTYRLTTRLEKLANGSFGCNGTPDTFNLQLTPP